MKKIKKRLEKPYYDLLRELDFSEIEDQIRFDDEKCIFEANSELFPIIFNENIVALGMDENHDQCTEYGRRLYMLYDLMFFSDYGDFQGEDDGEG